MREYIDLVLMADTHELHREVEVPAGDVLIHAGDFTMFSRSLAAICDFNDWLGELPHRHKIVCGGNHEFFLEVDPTRRSLLSNAIVLLGEGIDLEGLRIWASPVTPGHGAAFGIISPEKRASHWAKVPAVDVLVTHGPPQGILDRSHGQAEGIGDPELLAAVERIRPLLHVFGHVHAGYGQMSVGETLHVNCALLGLDGAIVNRPVVLRIPRRRVGARA
jgi:predicted phosphohydrolase